MGCDSICCCGWSVCGSGAFGDVHAELVFQRLHIHRSAVSEITELSTGAGNARQWRSESNERSLHCCIGRKLERVVPRRTIGPRNPLEEFSHPVGFVGLAQGCPANSLSHCSSNALFISSIEWPVSVPEGRNFQSHAEQPKP